ncbi:MAG: YCF48-related protein [Crocinitomicaceae bacterium]
MKALLIGILLCTLGTAWSQSTWYEVPTPTTNKLNDIDFVDSSVGYIVGDCTTILKTTDGGENWLELNHTGISTNTWSHELVDVDFVDEQIGFVSLLNDNHGVYKTVDGGMTWTPASNTSSNMCYKSCTYVNSENDYFIGGAGCFQSAQVNHFVNSVWNISTVNYETFNPGDYVVELDFNNGIGLAALNGRYMLRSIDNGATWDSLPAFFPSTNSNEVLTSVMFASADTVFAGYEYPNIPGTGFLMSVDAGLTWTNVNIPSFVSPAARDFTKAGNSDIYGGGITASWHDMGVIFETTDGINWSETFVLETINGMDNYGSDVVFAVGDSGYVVTNVPLGNIGVDEGQAFSSISIYPNPTTDIITIRNESNEPMVYTLINAQGVVLMEHFEAIDGNTLDLSQMPSGMYFLKPASELYPTVYKISKM